MGLYCMGLLLAGLHFLLTLNIADSRDVVSLYCPRHEQHPTIKEALIAAFPSLAWDMRMEGLWNELELPEGLQSTSQIASDLLQQKLYLTSWMSDAYYTVTFNATLDSLSFADVFVVQESHFRYNLICQLFPRHVPYISNLCHCSAASQFQYSHLWNRDGTLFDREGYVDKARWCLRRAPCTSRDLQYGKCQINIDPVRRSCLVLQHQELDSSQHWNIIDKIAQHEEHIPMLEQVLPTGWKKKHYHEYQKIAKEYIIKFLSHFPYYLFNLAVGMLIMYYASDLAEETLFHLFLEAFVGIFFAVFVLAFVGQKIISRMFGTVSRATFGVVQIPALFSIMYLVVSNPLASAYVRDLLYDFWDNGAFGFPWLGKVYFFTCITLSLSISKYFKLFEEGSTLSAFMIYSVKIIGIMFLCNASSNLEVAMFIILVGLCAEYVRDGVNFMYFMVNAKPPKYVANQKKMSEEEFAAFQSANTKKHLENLRQHLQKENRELYKNYDRLTVNGKTHEAELLKRFVQGSYAGKPDSPPLPAKKKTSILTYIVITILSLVACLAGIIFYQNPALLLQLYDAVMDKFHS